LDDGLTKDLWVLYSGPAMLLLSSSQASLLESRHYDSTLVALAREGGAAWRKLGIHSSLAEGTDVRGNLDLTATNEMTYKRPEMCRVNARGGEQVM
jgi:hypothetical protein